MVSSGTRDGQITADDHGPVIDIVAWFLMVTMILAVIFRLISRTILTHSGRRGRNYMRLFGTTNVLVIL